MTQEELINKIKEAQKEFFDKNPCKNCVGNGCDDCRHCDEASLRYELSSKLFKLKEEFKKIYNIDYDDYINNQKSQSQYSLNKELLLKDLSARLPYKVKVYYLKCNNHDWYTLESIDISDDELYISASDPYCNEFVKTDNVKPYLFPLSSMTEEQKEDMIKSSCGYGSDKNVFDWYNKNYFDYRGLISMGLALDATGLNIY